MSGTGPEPSNWELSRSITRIESSINGLGTRLEAKFDGLAGIYVTKDLHNGLVTRVDGIEQATSKRSDRNLSIYIAAGSALFGGLVAIVCLIITLVAK